MGGPAIALWLERDRSFCNKATGFVLRELISGAPRRSGPPSRRRRSGATAVALAEAEAGHGAPASDGIRGPHHADFAWWGGMGPARLRREAASARSRRSAFGAKADGAKPPGN